MLFFFIILPRTQNTTLEFPESGNQGKYGALVTKSKPGSVSELTSNSAIAFSR